MVSRYATPSRVKADVVARTSQRCMRTKQIMESSISVPESKLGAARRSGGATALLVSRISPPQSAVEPAANSILFRTVATQLRVRQPAAVEIRLIRIAVRPPGKERHRNDRQIERERPMIDVVEIVFDT